MNVEEEKSRRSEEGRVLVGLGLIAVAVAYRADLPSSFPFPLPTPTPHLQVFTIPVFDSSVLFFSIYAACMGLYFTEDIGGLTYFWRKLSQRTGHAFLAGYAFMLFWYLVTALGWLLVPDPLLLLYAVIYDISLIYIFALILDIVSDRWGRTNRIISQRGGSIFGAFKPHLIVEIARSWERYRGNLPKTLRRTIKRLGSYAGWNRTFDRNVRRAYIGLIPSLVISFFAFRQVRLSQGETPEFALVEALLILLLQMGVTILIMNLASQNGELSRAR
jgi:hypothetical protein